MVKKLFLNLNNQYWHRAQEITEYLFPVLVLFFWISVGAVSTNNFSNLTQESQRRDLLFEQQPSLSFIKVIDDNGRVTDISQIAALEKKVLIAEFIYTRCKTICISLGNMFQQTQSEIIKNSLGKQLGLVSISFDVANEDVHSLQTYRKRMRAYTEVWSLVKLYDLKVLEAVKNKLGLIVLENNQKDYVHNSAFIVISQQGNLIGIYDITEISGAIELAIQKLPVEQYAI